MDRVREAFHERCAELDDYIAFLRNMSEIVREGALRNADGSSLMTPSQQRVLFSSVYVQLYNMVESTVSLCLARLCEVLEGSGHIPGSWSDDVRREWLRWALKTHEALSPDNRLNTSCDIVALLLAGGPVGRVAIEKGGGGNWDDEEIFNFFKKRLGCPLRLSRSVQKGIKEKLRDGLGCLKVVRDYRNKLAHGNITFGECAAGLTVGELEGIAQRTKDYLAEVIDSFSEYLESESFLLPGVRSPRPAPAA